MFSVGAILLEILITLQIRCISPSTSKHKLNECRPFWLAENILPAAKSFKALCEIRKTISPSVIKINIRINKPNSRRRPQFFLIQRLQHSLAAGPFFFKVKVGSKARRVRHQLLDRDAFDLFVLYLWNVFADRVREAQFCPARRGS